MTDPFLPTPQLPILVTGASGHIGSHLVNYLHAHGHTVTALDISPLPSTIHQPLPKGSDFHLIDLTDHLAVEEIFASRTASLSKLTSSLSPTPPHFDGLIQLAAFRGPNESQVHERMRMVIAS